MHKASQTYDINLVDYILLYFFNSNKNPQFQYNKFF